MARKGLIGCHDFAMTESAPSRITLYRIRSLDDVRYDAYLDIYQTSFPLDEQMLVSSLNRIVREIAAGRDTGSTLAVGVDETGQVAAMVYYEADAEAVGAALWYLAVSGSMRCRGLGTEVYQAVATRIRQERPSIRALVFEVERPEDAEGDRRRLAERRIAFYRRNGAKLLGGIRYTQSVGWQPPVPMHVMVHPFDPLTPEAAFEIARSVLGDAVEAVGELSLE